MRKLRVALRPRRNLRLCTQRNLYLHLLRCKCSQRAKEMERYIRVAALLELDCNIAISIEELRRIAKIAKWKRLDMTYLAYNLGIVMASEVYKRGEQL